MAESISALVPTFNRCELLYEALSALKRQTVPVEQIIVIDDGSTDGTKGICEQFPGVEYIFQQNCGKAAALNNGLKYCRGELIWICDDDDVALPQAAEVLRNALEASGADYAFGTYQRFTINEKTNLPVIKSCGYWPDLHGRSFFITTLEDFYINQNAMLVRKVVFDRVGLFRQDLIRSQDYEMAIRITRDNIGVHVPTHVFLQRDHEGLRGHSATRFHPDRQVEQWNKYNAVIFTELFHKIPLNEFATESLSVVPDQRQRVALLQRACIFARKKLWAISYSDLVEVVRHFASWPISDHELRICGRFLQSKHGCEEVVSDPSIAEQLTAISRMSEFGRVVVRAITKPLLWHSADAIRNRNFGLAFGFLFLLGRTNGYVRSLGLLIQAAVRRLRTSESLAHR